MQRVAHRAGVSVATFHRRFPGRDALVAELAEQALRELVDTFGELARTTPADRALEGALRVVAAESVVTRACTPGHRDRFPERALALDEHLHRELSGLLTNAQADGRIAAAVTAQDLRLVTTAVTAAASAPEAAQAGRAAQRTVTHFMRSFRRVG